MIKILVYVTPLQEIFLVVKKVLLNKIQSMEKSVSVFILINLEKCETNCNFCALIDIDQYECKSCKY